jgi:hypothetical protein
MLRRGGIYHRTTRGIGIYLATPRLRGRLDHLSDRTVMLAGAAVLATTLLYMGARSGSAAVLFIDADQ